MPSRSVWFNGGTVEEARGGTSRQPSREDRQAMAHTNGTAVVVTTTNGTARGVVESTKSGWVTVLLPTGELLKARAGSVAEAPAEEPIAEQTRCECGCGEATAKRRVFRQGHDQRHKGNLLRLAVAGSDAALAELVQRSWRTEADVLGRRADAEAKAAKAANATAA